MTSDPSTVEFIVDQQLRQVQNLQALMPINGPQVVGVDGSKTPPQVNSLVSSMDGELPRPAGAGNDQYRKARDIRRDPTVRMVRQLAMAPILMAEWEYIADDDAPEGAKELVESIMTQMRLPLLHTSLCGMTDYGWQPYEVIAEQRDDGVSAPRLKPLLQDLTSILVNAADGSFFGLRQTPTVGTRLGWIYMLDQECLVISQDVEGTNWYGESTLRSIEKTYDEAEVVGKSSRKYDAKIAGTHWVIYYPLGTSDFGGQLLDNGEIATKLLSQAEAVGGIAVPRSVINVLDSMNAAQAQSEASQWKIELLSDAGKGQQPFTDRQKYLDVLKVRAFGFPERAILEGQFGTKAEAETHADVAVSNLEVRHALVCLQYSVKIVNLILAWNYGPQAKGKVRIKPSPLADDTKSFFRQLYLAMIANPQGFMTEISAIDLQRLRDVIGVPEHPMMAQAAPDHWASMTDPETGQLLMPPDDGSSAFMPPPDQTPVSFSLADSIDAAAGAACKPTDAQREAGNYRKGHVTIHGLRIAIETPRGEKRKKKWPKLPAHYGYFKGSVGADGDQVDVFIGPKPATEVAFVANMKGKDGKFDEHKALLGFKSAAAAREALSEAYGEADHRIGKITAMTIPTLKEWLSRPAKVALAFPAPFEESKHSRNHGKFAPKGQSQGASPQAAPGARATANMYNQQPAAPQQRPLTRQDVQAQKRQAFQQAKEAKVKSRVANQMEHDRQTARGLVTPGTIDLTRRPQVKNEDGSVSTVRSMSVNMDGKEVLIPTVSAIQNRVLSEDEAIAEYQQTGQHLGIFKSSGAASAYAEKLHQQQAEFYKQPDGA